MIDDSLRITAIFVTVFLILKFKPKDRILPCCGGVWLVRDDTLLSTRLLSSHGCNQVLFYPISSRLSPLCLRGNEPLLNGFYCIFIGIYCFK